MTSKNYTFFILQIGVCFLLIGCQSVSKYNANIQKNHSVHELRKDVDIAYQELQKYQPQLYQYISKEQLDYSFDSLKNTITQPMNSKEFAYKLERVVNKVGQAHNSVAIPNKRYTKQERKQRRKYKFEISELFFDNVGDTIFVRRDLTEDSIYTHAQLIAINGEDIRAIWDREMAQITSDGYNQTFRSKVAGKSLLAMWKTRKGELDSVELTFKKEDSVWTKQFKRTLKSKKQNKKAQDSLKHQLSDLNNSELQHKKKPSKKERKRKAKTEREEKSKKGFNYITEEYNRELKFIGEDSTVAYLKIRSFTRGDYESFYEEAFAKIDSIGSDFLILDLRDNTGGRLNEINELYAYLTDQEYQFLIPSEIKKRSAQFDAVYSNASPFLKGFLIVSAPVTYPLLSIKTKKDKEGQLRYQFSSSKIQEPKENAFKGKIYVLINGMSFSASSTLATVLDNTTDAIFVGEEAGGDYNGTVAGMHKKKVLPNSNVTLNLGVFYIETPYKRDVKGRGISPDIEIQNTYQDILEGRDRELNWILEDIQKGKL